MQSKEFITKVEKYIYIKNNRYELNSTINSDENINKQEINTLKNILIYSNNDLDKLSKTMEIKNLSVSNGIIIEPKQIDTNTKYYELAVAGGVCQLVKFWWGLYIYLTADQTNYMIWGVSTAAAATITALFPGVGAVIALGLGILVVHLSNTSPETVYGSVVSYNYVEGPQEVWAQ